MLGAFGAHGLKTLLDASALEIWDTAVLYQLIHALALLITGGLAGNPPTKATQVAGIAFGIGILLFSGSLYLLALGGPHLLGPVTPVGGLALIVGWFALFWSQWSGPAA
jgi:uncharacterized membrane protein YgdD (TMEM256/DUF423 family)